MSLRLFVDGPLHADSELDLPPGPARHVQVRRAQPGDALVLFDGRGGEWQAEILHMGRQQVTVRVRTHDPVTREAAGAVTIAVGMPANERMDNLVEKATELGVAAIQPLVTERSVLRLAGERAERKRVHWQGIAEAASEQCGRTRVPVVAAVQSFERWLDTLAAGGSRRLLAPGAPMPRRAGEDLPVDAPVCVLSGPEGGLAPHEAAAAEARGFLPLGLGPRVLRADTAPLVVLAWWLLRE